MTTTYFRVPQRLFAANLGTCAMAVYVAIAGSADNKTAEAWPSLRTIAERAGVSRPTAVKYIDELAAAGLIVKKTRTRDDGGRASNFYVLPDLIQADDQAHSTPSQPTLQGGVNEVDGVVNEVNPLVKPVNYPSKAALPPQLTGLTTPVNQVNPNYINITNSTELDPENKAADAHAGAREQTAAAAPTNTPVDSSQEDRHPILGWYERTFSNLLTPRMVDYLLDLAKEYPADVLEAAFDEAKANNAYAIQYVEKILARRKAEAADPGRSKSVKPPQPARSDPPPIPMRTIDPAIAAQFDIHKIGRQLPAAQPRRDTTAKTGGAS